MIAKNVKSFQDCESVYGIVLAKILPAKITKKLESGIAEPHRHDCYLIIVEETGEANLRIDFQDVTINPNSLLLIRSGQAMYIKLN